MNIYLYNQLYADITGRPYRILKGMNHVGQMFIHAERCDATLNWQVIWRTLVRRPPREDGSVVSLSKETANLAVHDARALPALPSLSPSLSEQGGPELTCTRRAPTHPPPDTHSWTEGAIHNSVPPGEHLSLSPPVKPRSCSLHTARGPRRRCGCFPLRSGRRSNLGEGRMRVANDFQRRRKDRAEPGTDSQCWSSRDVNIAMPCFMHHHLPRSASSSPGPGRGALF